MLPLLLQVSELPSNVSGRRVTGTRERIWNTLGPNTETSALAMLHEVSKLRTACKLYHDRSDKVTNAKQIRWGAVCLNENLISSTASAVKQKLHIKGVDPNTYTISSTPYCKYVLIMSEHR